MRRFIVLLPLAAVLVVVGIGLFRHRTDAAVGGPAPAFELPRLDGRGSISLDGLSGRPAVLNFWASWCEPCRDEAPELAASARRAKEAAFIGVNFRDARSDARAFERRYDVPYPSVRDVTGRVAARYGVTGAPETFFIDASGRIAGRYIGALTSELLDSLLQDLASLGPDEVLDITGRGEFRPVP